MGSLTQAAIDAAFTESLTKLLIAHNTMVLTGEVCDYPKLLSSVRVLKQERLSMLALFKPD